MKCENAPQCKSEACVTLTRSSDNYPRPQDLCGYCAAKVIERNRDRLLIPTDNQQPSK